MKKTIIFVKTFLLCVIGAWIGAAVYRFVDYKMHPEVYAAQSAPWYTDILIQGIITAVLVIVCVIVLLILKRKKKRFIRK